MREKTLGERMEALREFYSRTGRMPSYSELASLLGFRSRNSAYKFIKKLLSLSYVKRDEKGKLLPGRLFGSVKVLGSVQAGFPSPAEEELLDTITLDRWLISHPSSTYMLKVSGDSMIEAGIMPGDFVLVDRSIEAKDGDIVVAQVDGEWTMKYLRKRKGGVVLLPANKNYPPIKPSRELIIGGVVISVIRKLK